MPGLVDCGVVLRTALPSGNALFTSFDRSLQGLVASTIFYSTAGIPLHTLFILVHPAYP